GQLPVVRRRVDRDGPACAAVQEAKGMRGREVNMTRLAMIATATILLSCGSVLAQVSGSAPAPLGITSPLGIGPAPAVPGTGIPRRAPAAAAYPWVRPSSASVG